MTIDLTVGYESYSINLAAGGDTPAAIINAINSASLGITAEYTASNTILLTGQKGKIVTITLNDTDGNPIGINFNNNQEASSEILLTM